MRSKASEFPADLADLADQAKALSHPARLRILQLLAEADTCICGELVDALPLAQASVSRHLQVLREADLITATSDGPRTCYCLKESAVGALADAFNAYIGPLHDHAAPAHRGGE